MVMHSNERGECCLRTLVDRKCKRYDNAVDVVVRLHGPTDQAPKLPHLRVLAHVQLDDNPRTPIQQSVGEEFCQHNGVVMILISTVAGLRLSTATILSRTMVEGGTAHG